MKIITGSILLAVGVSAFPTAMDPAKVDEAIEMGKRQIPGTGPGLSKTFNAKRQLVSVSGVNKFVPPDFAKGDQRGPCPGLNALANHGYLPHNGVGSIVDFTFATNEVYGLAYDIAAGFAVFGAVTAGDGLTWSIGGPPNLGLSVPEPNLIGRAKGISFTHNEYEGDGSATRHDYYSAGEDYKVNMHYFKQLYNILPAKSYDTLAAHRNTRVMDGIANNPYYFNGPFTGVAVAGGANAFVFRLIANHSAEYPQGYLDKYTFKTFWGVRGEGEKMYSKGGWDQIPSNWYRRPHDDEYSIPFIAQDLARNIILHPESAKVGGNLGKTNTFTGVDITNLTGGVYHAKDLAKGNNAACFAFQAGQLLVPDIAAKIFHDITAPMAKLDKAFNGLLAPLNCPKLEKLNTKYLNQYPGYKHPHRHE